MAKALLKTFPLSHDKRKRVTKSLGLGDMKSVRHRGIGPLGNCYWNVNEHVKREGGAAAYGWLILYWPKLYVEAIHHAVWHCPDGSFLDITEKYDTDHLARSTFIFDDTQTVNLTAPTYIVSRHVALKKAPEVEQLFETYRDQIRCKKILSDKAISLGGRYNPEMGGLQIPQAIGPQIENEHKAVLATERRMDSAFEACAKL